MKSLNFTVRSTGLLALVLSLFTAGAVSASPLYGPRTFSVEVTGSGPPMILIPGLASSGAVWDETVASYQQHYTCHVLTLAGFAGAPPAAATPFLEAVRDELAAYIREHAPEKPVVVGHSLGGFLAMWLAATEPDLAGRLVIVDSLPYLGAAQVPKATPEMMKPQAEQMRAGIAAQTQEQFRQAQAQILPTMITDSADVARALKTGGESDPVTVGQAMYELFTIDLREDIARIQVPTLVMGTWIGYRPYGVTREQIQASFETQYARLEGAKIVLFDEALHFIMYDDLDGLLNEMNHFLAAQ